MNITWIPRTRSRHGASTLRLGVALSVALATLAWTAAGKVADAQQIKNLQHGGQSFAVVPAAQAEGLFAMPSLSEPLSDFDAGVEQVGFYGGHGSRCGSGQCGSGSGGSGPGGLNCPTCNPYRYARVEAVVMRREGLENFTRHRPNLLSEATFRLDEHDFEFAPRITIGSVPDCVSGYEASFTGPVEWDMSSSAINIPGTTRLTLIAPPDPDAAFVFQGNPANNIDFQHQRYESTYWSAEASRTAMAWDIAKLLFGARYINFDEKYRYLAVDGPNPVDIGQIYSRTRNNMIGLQVGLDMFSPITLNTSSYLRARGGGYLNIAEATAVVDDQDRRLYAMDDDRNRLAAMLEIGSGLHYRLGERLSVQGGVEMWYLTEVATAEDQIPTFVGAGAPGGSISTGDDVLFIGFNFGATLQF